MIDTIPDEITTPDEVTTLLDKHRQLLKEYQQLAADLSGRLISALGDRGTPKSFVEKCQQFKTQNPKGFIELNQQLDIKMSSFVANQRHLEQKPLNRKGVRGRTWV